MPNTVSWNLQLTVQDGRLADARALMTEMVEATQHEPGTVGYEWFLSADGSACHIYERYTDAAAALVHVGNFVAHFAERFMACFAPTALFVYGEPDDALRAALDGLGAVYLEWLGGFRR